MHYLVDKEEFLRALSELEDELLIETLDTGNLLSHCWRCLECDTEYTAFEMIPAPMACRCGELKMVPVLPTLH